MRAETASTSRHTSSNDGRSRYMKKACCARTRARQLFNNTFLDARRQTTRRTRRASVQRIPPSRAVAIAVTALVSPSHSASALQHPQTPPTHPKPSHPRRPNVVFPAETWALKYFGEDVASVADARFHTLAPPRTSRAEGRNDCQRDTRATRMHGSITDSDDDDQDERRAVPSPGGRGRAAARPRPRAAENDRSTV